MMCETVVDYLGNKKISAVNLLPVPKGVFQHGEIRDQKAFSKLLRKGVKTAKPKPMTAHEIVFEVPEEHTFQHTMTMPDNLSEEQIREAVALEAEKLLPFELDQTSWDIKIIPTIGGSTTVIFSGIQLELIQGYYNAFIGAGFLPLGFSLHFENIYLALLSKAQAPLLVLDIQPKYTSIMLLRDRRIVTLSQISMGEEDFKKAIAEKYQYDKKSLRQKLKEMDQVDFNLAMVEVMKKYTQEFKEIHQQFLRLNQTIETDQKKQASTRTRDVASRKTSREKGSDNSKLKTQAQQHAGSFEMYLVGSEFSEQVMRYYLAEHPDSIFKDLKVNLSANFDIETRVKNQLVQLQRADKTHELNRLFPSVYGASLANYSSRHRWERPLNLLPLMVRSIAVWKETNTWFYLCSSLLLILSVTWLMAFGFQWGSTYAQLRVASSNAIAIERQLEYKKATDIEGKVSQANRELKILTELQSSKNPYADIFQTIRDIMPEGVRLTAFNYGIFKDKTLFEVKAESQERELIIQTHMALKSLAFVNQVIFPPSNLDQRDPYLFSLQFNLKPGLNLKTLSPGS